MSEKKQQMIRRETVFFFSKKVREVLSLHESRKHIPSKIENSLGLVSTKGIR